LCFLTAATLLAAATVSSAQSPASSNDGHHAKEGPAPLEAPTPPEVIRRDPQLGTVVVRATRLPAPIAVDGHLDEPLYRTTKSIGGFIQQEPHEGQPATVRTEVWVFFDDRQVYVSARCWQDPSLPLIGHELRRDAQTMFDNDNFAVVFDTFLDRRSGIMFQTNPVGAVNDQLMTDDGAGSNRDWNTVFTVRTSRDREGWSVEMAIPFSSLRFPSGRAQTWGLNFRRNVQARTEYSYLTKIPASVGRRGLGRTSLAATLVGIEIDRPPSRFEIKPYALASRVTNRDAEPVLLGDGAAKMGLDAKGGVGAGLTADLTVNTDFAQVEEDEAQVNLTRFSLFQPEKRDFFLEGQGMFAFGGIPVGRPPTGQAPPEAPILFYSRSIGLADGAPVTIVGGGRVTGHVGARWSLGGMQLYQAASLAGELPATGFTVFRLRRDVLRRSSIGLIYTRRTPSETGADANNVGGFDVLFAPSQDLVVNAYVAKSATPGLKGEDISARGRLDYNSDRYGLQLEQLVVPPNFNPEVGLLRREDYRRSLAGGRFSRWPSGIAWLRKWNVTGEMDYVTDNDGRLESRNQQAGLRLELANGDFASVTPARAHEVVTEGIELTHDYTIPVGTYQFGSTRVSYELGPRHRFKGTVTAGGGGLYGGSVRELSYKGRVDVVGPFSLEPSIVLNHVEMPGAGRFWINAVGLRGVLPISPRSVVSVLVQHRSDDGALGASVRWRWEYAPGSELFVVYSEGRDTTAPIEAVRNRSFVVKITRLFRF
jgi:hypothetical protein